MTKQEILQAIALKQAEIEELQNQLTEIEKLDEINVGKRIVINSPCSIVHNEQGVVIETNVYDGSQYLVRLDNFPFNRRYLLHELTLLD